MEVQSMHFKARAGHKLADERLQANLKKLSSKFVSSRAEAVAQIDFAATREALKDCRTHTLEALDVWLERFEREAGRRGTTVLYAETTRTRRASSPRSRRSTRSRRSSRPSRW